MVDRNVLLRQAIKCTPAVVPFLKGRARWLAYEPIAWKSQEYYLQHIQGLIRGVYDGNVGGEFIDVMANLISGQLTDAYNQAWLDDNNVLPFPDYLESSLEKDILDQYDYVDQLYRDTVDARVDGTPVDPLLSRADLWANRWTESYNEATHLMTVEMGGNEMWELGATETHCPTCEGLDGVVARASEWDLADVHPQGGPNDKLFCGGWKCDCKRTPTDQRRSPDALTTIMNIIGATNG